MNKVRDIVDWYVPEGQEKIDQVGVFLKLLPSQV
jgi:hypothetical protein